MKQIILFLVINFLISYCNTNNDSQKKLAQSLLVEMQKSTTDSSYIPTYTMTNNPKFAFLSSKSSSKINSYTIDYYSGSLTSSNNFTSGISSPSKIISNIDGKYFYVINKASNTIKQMNLEKTTGTFIGGLATSVTGSTLEDILIHPNGKYLYSISSNANIVNGYALTNDSGILVDQSWNINIDSSSTPSRSKIHPTGKFLYTLSYSGNNIKSFSIDSNGKPVEKNILNFTFPSGIQIHPKGKYAYLINNTSQVSQTEINLSDGSISSDISQSELSSIPSSIIMNPYGTILYISIEDTQTIVIFYIHPFTGKLIKNDTISTKTKPKELVIEPTGNFLYSINTSENSVTYYKINNASGALTFGGTISTDAEPFSLVFY